MRLAMVTNFPDREGVVTGGVEGVAACLVDGLRCYAGLEIHVVSPTFEGRARKENRGEVTVHWLPMPKGPPFLTYWTVFRKRMHDLLREIAPDVTHFQGVAGWTIGYGGPYVLTLHGISEKGARYSGALSGILKGAVFAAVEGAGRSRSDNLIVISPYLQTALAGQLRGRQWQIENPVEPAFFDVCREPEASNILYVGRLSRLKNVEGVLESFAKVAARHPWARLVIAGKEENAGYLAALKRYAAEIGIAGLVTFPGNLDRPSLLRELSRAACLLLLSRQETAPMVVAEAMAAGVPVIASRICGVPYLLKEGETGFLVDPDDVDAVAARLEPLLLDPELNRAFGARARAVAAERFHRDQVARRTYEVYSYLHRQGRRGQRVG